MTERKIAMKKYAALLLALIMLFTCAACGTDGSASQPDTWNVPANSGSTPGPAGDALEAEASSDPKVKLSMANFLAAGNPYEVFLNYIFTEIYNRSGGTVEITYYPGGTLCGQGDMLDGIINGVADIGYVQIADNVSSFPELATIEQPGMYFSSAPAITGAFGEYIDTYAPAELGEFKVLSYMYGTKGCICSNGGPIHTPGDLAGKTIRSTGTMAKAITAFGGVPTDVAIADCYESLRQGVIDGIMTIRGAIYTWNLCEVLDYGMDYPLYNNGGMFIMNQDAWDRLTDNQKQAVTSSFDDAYEVCLRFMMNDFYKEPSAMRLKEEMMEYYYPTDEEIEQFRGLISGGVDDYIATLNANGYEGDEILRRWQELADKWNAEYPAKSDDDPDMYIALNPTTGERLQCGAGTDFEWTLPYTS